MKPSERLSTFKPYFFAEVNRRLNDLVSQGIEVIRLDVGSPDMPPADFITAALVEAARQPDAHGYQPYGGTTAYRQAIAAYYQNRFGVQLDPAHEVVGLIGSKEGIFNLSQALLDPGDLVLVPDPSYPTYERGALAAGAEVHPLLLRQENEYLPDFDSIPPEVAEKARILWLNYPNNPTSAIAGLDFFQRALDFARRNEVLIAHDAAYTEVSYDGYRAPSILEVPGAKDWAVEFNSLSKAYNMAGWRLGMASGNARALGFLDRYKIQVDSSHFKAIMQAGVAALTGDQGWVAGRNSIYEVRRNLIVETLTVAGFHTRIPKASLYVWAQLPAGVDGDHFCERMLEEIHVSMAPGETFGEGGRGFIRLSMGTPTDQVREAMRRFVDWVPSYLRPMRI